MDIIQQIIDYENDTTDEMVDMNNNESFSSDDSESDDSESEETLIQPNQNSQSTTPNQDQIIDFQFSKYSWCCPLL